MKTKKKKEIGKGRKNMEKGDKAGKAEEIK
jgi:hypothetical protein